MTESAESVGRLFLVRDGAGSLGSVARGDGGEGAGNVRGEVLALGGVSWVVVVGLDGDGCACYRIAKCSARMTFPS